MVCQAIVIRWSLHLIDTEAQVLSRRSALAQSSPELQAPFGRNNYFAAASFSSFFSLGLGVSAGAIGSPQM
jgi:hypothetical protein